MDELEFKALTLVRSEIQAMNGFGSSMCGELSPELRKATAQKMSERNSRILAWLDAVLARHQPKAPA